MTHYKVQVELNKKGYTATLYPPYQVSEHISSFNMRRFNNIYIISRSSATTPYFEKKQIIYF